jgi:hypothetical protein
MTTQGATHLVGCLVWVPGSDTDQQGLITEPAGEQTARDYPERGSTVYAVGAHLRERGLRVQFGEPGVAAARVQLRSSGAHPTAILRAAFRRVGQLREAESAETIRAKLRWRSCCIFPSRSRIVFGCAGKVCDGPVECPCFIFRHVEAVLPPGGQDGLDSAGHRLARADSVVITSRYGTQNRQSPASMAASAL